jgi:hypothetical protein
MARRLAYNSAQRQRGNKLFSAVIASCLFVVLDLATSTGIEEIEKEILAVYPRRLST